MKVKEIMTKAVVSIHPETTLKEAAQLMKKYEVGFLPVMEGNSVLGVLTDRDMVLGAAANGWVPVLTDARRIMHDDVAWCFEEEDVETAARIMAQKQVRRLIVFKKDMRVTGVLSLEDLAQKTPFDALTAETFRDVTNHYDKQPLAPTSV